jgi:hypothetical protein
VGLLAQLVGLDLFLFFKRMSDVSSNLFIQKNSKRHIICFLQNSTINFMVFSIKKQQPTCGTKIELLTTKRTEHQIIKKDERTKMNFPNKI